jgi:hypothetical protein
MISRPQRFPEEGLFTNAGIAVIILKSKLLLVKPGL